MKNLDSTKFWIEEVFGGTEMINLLVQEYIKVNPSIQGSAVQIIQNGCSKLLNELAVRFAYKHKPKLPFSDSWESNADENIKMNSIFFIRLIKLINLFSIENMQQIIESNFDFETIYGEDDSNLLIYNLFISHITSSDITYYIRNLILTYVLRVNAENILLKIMDPTNIDYLCKEIFDIMAKNLVGISDAFKMILKSIFPGITDIQNIPSIASLIKETLKSLKRYHCTFGHFLKYRKIIPKENFEKFITLVGSSEYKEVARIFDIDNFINIATVMKLDKFIIKDFEESIKNKTEQLEDDHYKVTYNDRFPSHKTIIMSDVIKKCYNEGIRVLIGIEAVTSWADNMDSDDEFSGDLFDKALYSDTFNNYHDKILDLIKKEFTEYVSYLYTIDDFKIIFPDIGEPAELTAQLLNSFIFTRSIKMHLINFNNTSDIIANFYEMIVNKNIHNVNTTFIQSFDKKLLFDYYPSYLFADIDIESYDYDINELVAAATTVFKNNYKNYFKMAMKKEFNLEHISSLLQKLVSTRFKELKAISSNILEKKPTIADITRMILQRNYSNNNQSDSSYIAMIIFKEILKNRNYKHENTLNLNIVNVSGIYEDYIEKETEEYASILKYIDLDDKEVQTYLEGFLAKITQSYFDILKSKTTRSNNSDLKNIVYLMETNFGMIPEAKAAIMTFKKILFKIVKDEDAFYKTSILPPFITNKLLIRNLISNNIISRQEILDANIKTIDELKDYIKEVLINLINTELLNFVNQEDTISFYESLVNSSDLIPSSQIIDFHSNFNKPVKYTYENGFIQRATIISNSFIYSERLAYIFYFILKSLYPSDVQDGVVLNAEADEFCLKMIPDLNKILKITDPAKLLESLTSILSSLIIEYKDLDNIKNIFKKICVSSNSNGHFSMQQFFENPYNTVLLPSARPDRLAFQTIKNDSSKILTCEFKNGKDISEGIAEDAEKIKLKYLGLTFDGTKIRVVPVDNDCNIASFLASVLKTSKISRMDKISLISTIANVIHNMIHQRTDGLKIYINGAFYFREMDATDWKPYPDMDNKIKMLEEAINAFLTSVKQKNSKLEIEKINVLTEKMVEILNINFSEKMLNELKTANLGNKVFEVINKIYLAKKSGLTAENYFDEMIKIISEISDSLSYNIRIIKSAIVYITTFNVLKIYIGYAKKNPKVKEVFDPMSETADGAFRFRVLNNMDPYHFQVGNDTNCCQAIGNFGEAAAVDSYINSTAGVLLLEMKNSENWILLSQSYFHVVLENSTKKVPLARDYDSPDWDDSDFEALLEDNKKNNAPVKPAEKMIILDNIETAQQAVDLATKTWGGDIIKSLYYSLAEYLKAKGWDKVLCGKEWTKAIDEKDFKSATLKSDPRFFEIGENGIKDHLEEYVSDIQDIVDKKINALIKILDKEKSIIYEYELSLEGDYSEDELAAALPDISNLTFDSYNEYYDFLSNLDKMDISKGTTLINDYEFSNKEVYNLCSEIDGLTKEVKYLRDRISKIEIYSDFSPESSFDLTAPAKNLEKIKLEAQSLDKMAANLFIPLIKNAKIRALATELLNIDNYILSVMLNTLL